MRPDFGLLGHECEAKLLLHHSGKETPHRMRLPPRRFRNSCNGSAAFASQQTEHAIMFRSGAGLAGPALERLEDLGRTRLFGLVFVIGTSEVGDTIVAPPRPRQG